MQIFIMLILTIIQHYSDVCFFYSEVENDSLLLSSSSFCLFCVHASSGETFKLAKLPLDAMEQKGTFMLTQIHLASLYITVVFY